MLWPGWQRTQTTRRQRDDPHHGPQAPNHRRPHLTRNTERDITHEARCRQCGHVGLEYIPLVDADGTRMPLSVCGTCTDSREI
jgi:hypothetical protein